VHIFTTLTSPTASVSTDCASLKPLHPTAALGGVLGRARLQVLRSTVLLSLVIAASSLVAAAVLSSPNEGTRATAVALAATWCAIWAAAATFPRATASVFASWRLTALVLVAANTATVSVTGGITSPLLSVSIYVGWIASVVLRTRAAAAMTVAISASIFAGYFAAGASLGDVFTGPQRYAAITAAMLPIVTGVVGVLLAGVTNSIFNRLPEMLDDLRAGRDATTPALTAVLARVDVRALPPAIISGRSEATKRIALTNAERAVVTLLAEGHTPQQIAILRGVAISTTRSQIKSAKRKAGARTIDELIAAAWEESA
jgi:DNA-binding CsgD family transcriptional regulator